MLNKDHLIRRRSNKIFSQSNNRFKQQDQYRQLQSQKYQKARQVAQEFQKQKFDSNRNSLEPRNSFSTNRSYLSKFNKRQVQNQEQTSNNKLSIRYRVKRTNKLLRKEQEQPRIKRIHTEDSRYDEQYNRIPIWQYRNLGESIYKRIQQKTYRGKYNDSYRGKETRESFFPVIDSVRFVNLSPSKYRKTLLSRVKEQSRENIKYLPILRKVVHAILFTLYLEKFTQKLRKNRDAYLSKFVCQNLKEKLVQLKEYLLESSRPFFMLVIDKYSIDYKLTIKDELVLQRQKINSLHKLVNFQMNCLQRCITQISNRDNLIQAIYYICKHGNYSNFYNINTIEELNLMCVSQEYGYIRADRYLQQSSILCLVFIKLLLFNILLRPQKLVLQTSDTVNRIILYNNIKLVANILYELFIDVQEDLMEKSPQTYTVGNWVLLKNRFNFRYAPSMTLRERYFKKNQLISGLASQKLIKQVYRTKQMIREKEMIVKLTVVLHRGVVKYHQKIKNQTFLL